jgi:putative nucleotidyltransferase with HDIG domain
MTTLAKSKDIQAYFKAALSQIKPGVVIPFDIHLYFRRNGHILVLRKKGQIPTKEFLANYVTKGIKEVWIHRDDTAAYKAYVSVTLAKQAETPSNLKMEPKANTSESASQKTSWSPPPFTGTQVHLDRRSQPIQDLISLLQDKAADPKRKAALIAKTARIIFKQALEAQDLDQQTEAHTAAQNIVKEIMKGIQCPSSSLISEIWNTPEIDSELTHASNVATYATLLALCFGRTDLELISDITLAGLLHDIGLSQVSYFVTSKPWTSFNSDMTSKYSKHVESGLEMINAFGTEIPERVKSMILNHHAKSQTLAGSAQLLVIAEWIDSISTGQWDGQKRTYKDSIATLEGLEAKNSEAQYCSPEILSILKQLAA